ncbi:STAS domain-containing protein [Streptomyces sp. NP160]|uniref:STAS domain-containing protein n=1 Tax=Streptomyces sp. NP160 TaxID=2586637 RepID=UPI0015D65CB3|nr:STAS domain-containing protein [Streptomyces sp. NP160]
MAHGLLIRLHHERGVPVLAVAGDLDFASADQLRLHGRELVDSALSPQGPDRVAQAVPVVVLDASQIAFVDSAGLGALVTLLKRTLAHRAGFSIAGASEPLRARLSTTGLDMVVALHSTVDEAVCAATGDPAPAARRCPVAGDTPGPRAGA